MTIPKQFDNVTAFSRRLRAAMFRRDLISRQLAEKTGICDSQISSYVNGRSAPGAMRLVILSLALDVSVDWLLGLSDQMELHNARETKGA